MAGAEKTMPNPQADPLADLRDIHLPAEIDSLPAPGWWLLALLCLLAAGFLLRYMWRVWQQRRYRSEAAAQLQILLTDYGITKDPATFLRGLNALLKRVALVSYPREQVAPLHGEAWVAFLDESGRSRAFTMGEGQVLIQGPYQPATDLDVDALSRLGARWIRRHQRGPGPSGNHRHA